MAKKLLFENVVKFAVREWNIRIWYADEGTAVLDKLATFNQLRLILMSLSDPVSSESFAADIANKLSGVNAVEVICNGASIGSVVYVDWP